MRYKKLVFVSCFLLFILTALASAETGSPQETLKQYINDLQKTPDDFALREKIINLVQKMKPQPTVPEEAIKYEGRAEAAFKSAKTKDEILDTAREYKKAILIAPWVANYYYNLGIVLEKAELYNEAIQNFKLYLLAAPNVTDLVDVKKKIAGLEYSSEKKAKEASAEWQAAQQKEKDAEFIRSLEGARFIYHDYDSEIKTDFTVLIRQGQAIWGGETVWKKPQYVNVDLGYSENGRSPLEGRTFRIRYPVDNLTFIGTISEDGKKLKLVQKYDDGKEQCPHGGRDEVGCWYTRK